MPLRSGGIGEEYATLIASVLVAAQNNFVAQSHKARSQLRTGHSFEQSPDGAIPRDLGSDRSARSAERRCVVAMLAEPARRASELPRVGGHAEPGSATRAALERAA